MSKEIFKFSNPDKVLENAKKIYGNDVEIRISNRKNKKYMIYNHNDDKWVHFGSMGYEDFTKHNDILRRNRFRNRNSKWTISSKFTPAYMSYYLLW